ncbi:hypothetical protein EMPS_05219 [Entomortierella parvispora]|uniref:Ion transport domain-containing protein n=1 Tax=Entomortierella parvispora TaxID=205924 RepID=A0A9P3H9X0_9FUNG|nr:hypothetical protein EMPS_05219 [Entomortierella parvispora]
MFWKKHRGDSTVQLQDMNESPPLVPSSTETTATNAPYSSIPTMADIDHEDEQKEKPLSSFAKLRAAVLSSTPEGPKKADPCEFPQRRFFFSNDMFFSRARMYTVSGRVQRPHFRPLPDMAASLPAETAAFKLCAEFKNYSAGHYSVHWRVKALENFSIPNGLHLVVNVWYETEPDISGTLDVIMPAHKLSLLAKDRWYNLMLEEKLVIQPHIGNCKVQVILCNNENQSRDDYAGLVIEHVEIRPMALKAEAQDDVWNMVAKRAAIPNFTIDTAKPQFIPQEASLLSSPAPITRIAVSKGSRFLATLGMTKDVAFIKVYDMGIVRNPTNASRSLNKLYKEAAIGTIRHEGVGDLAIGLAISTTGDQIALFQEPKIGQWADGADIEKASFRFRLFNNPLVRQQNVILDIDGPQPSIMDEKSPDQTEDRPCNDRNASYNTADPPVDATGPVQLIDVTWDSSLLQTFVGFGTFLPEMKKSDWEKNDVNSALGTSTEDENGDESNVADGGKSHETTRNSLFVTCNGLYLDVYEISPEKKWSRLHTITLSDLIPTLSRRITCKMMMEAISSNTFMWLEDGGRSCTIWNLLTGSNIAHISSIENARFKGSTFRGHTKMAISPHESIVALASVDGSLTTYFANTGMAIDDRKFPGYKIEHVGFHAQDDQLFVILRDSVTFELKSCILDTLQLKSQTPINQIPIPSIGTTTLAFFYTKGNWNRGIICEPDGSKINCYISHQPMSSKVIKTNEAVELAEPTDISCDSQFEEHKKYRLQTGFHKELLPEGDGVSYFVHRVEVIEENILEKTQKIIFSFVPEPWMRATTADVVHPENLLTAFFLPDWTRFAVNGMQSLQVWNLPTLENTKCSLQCFWSQPKDDKEIEPGGSAYKSTNVYDYYQDTLSTSVYVDTTSWNTVAEIKMNEKQRKKMISIPGPLSVGARYAILFCFRSVHLLAAAYSYSNRESKKTSRDGAQQSFTFEDHADAILRFTREHINRMMSIGVYSPKNRPGKPPRQPKPGKSPDMAEKDVSDEKQGKSSPGGRRESPRPAAAAVALGNEGANSSPSQAPVVVGEDFTMHGNANRRQDDEDDEFHLLHRDREDSQREALPINMTPAKARPDVVTVLTLLLDHPYLKRTNHTFVEGLLNSANGDWIPRDNKALNPIKRAIEVRNGPLVEAFLEYCIKNAKKYHPAYLMPAVQCLNELSDRYPAMLADMFRKASYVPAHNYGYVSSHAIIANHQYGEWLKSKLMFWTPKFEKSNNVNDYERPVFSLRSQLPFRAMRMLNILNIETSIRDKRHNKFPPKRDIAAEDEKRAMQSPYSHKIFVTPFPKLSMYGTYQPWTSGKATSKSAFIDIAGQDFFDSPAMVSTLEFKWHKFGFFYWSLRFMIVAVFFILVILITAEQISIFEATAKPGEDLQLRFMENWRPVFHTTTAFGFVLIAYEAYQFMDSPKKYIASPYNYMDLAAYVMPVVGCFLFLDYQIGKETQPRQVWVLSFSILALYINILFELRVIKQLGIVVNIILNITRRIVWFFLVFGLFLISFTHALLHLMKTDAYYPNEIDGLPTNSSDGPGYPDNFWSALSATYFFLAGRYDPVSNEFDYGSTSFHIMMVIFNFFTAILLLNILIALMNDAFNESKDQGQLAWLKQWSEVIAEVEVFLMTPGARQNRNYFPDYIYYGASEQEAELYESKYYIASKSNLSIENRFLVDTVSSEQKDAMRSQRAVLRDVQAVAKELVDLKAAQNGFNQDLSQLTELMAAYLAQTTTTTAPTTVSTTTVTTPGTESELSQSPTSESGAATSRVLPSSPTSPPPSAASTMGPSAPGTSGASWSSSAPPPPGSAGAPPGGVLRSSAFGSWPRRGGMKQSTAPAAVQQSQVQIPAGRPKVSPSAIETDSPTTYGPTVHFGAPGPSVKSSIPLTSGTLAGQLPGSGAIYYPEPSSSSSSTHYKVVEMPDPMGGSLVKDTQALLKRRLQQKLAVVHTMDDALKSHQAREENNMEHPIYVQPHARIKSSATTTTTITTSSSSSYGGHSQQVSSRWRRDSDDDGLYDDEDEGDEVSTLQGDVPRRKPSASHPQLEPAESHQIETHPPTTGTSSSGAPEVTPRRTQSEILLSEVPHEPVPLHVHPPFPPHQEDSPK